MFNSFKEIYKSTPDVVGAKAYNMAKSYFVINEELGVCIPKSLVLTNNEVSIFCNTTKRTPVLKAIKEYFDDKKIIIRSSSVYEDSKLFSAAGQYETCMNLYDEADIEKAILMVHNSSVTDSAKLYNELYQNNNKCYNDKMAVLIQEMVPCEHSGVLYTSNPINHSKEMLIEFSDGLGDKVASGEKDSITYNLDSLISSSAEVFIIDGEVKIQLKRLRRIAEKLIKAFGVPLDIEWGIYNDCLYILQTRSMFFCSSDISYIYDLELVNHSYAIKGRVISKGIAIGKMAQEDIFIAENMKCVEVNDIVEYNGIIVKKGGLLAHAASLVRELGRPCILIGNHRINAEYMYVLDAYKGEIISWDKLSLYEKSMYLWESFYHVAKNVNKKLLHITGIEKIEIGRRYESIIVGADLLYKKTDDYDCYEQYSTTYDIDGDELINYNIIVREQQTEKYVRLQIKHINLSKPTYRQDDEILFYFKSEKHLQSFIRHFPLHITGNQNRKVLELKFNDYAVKLIKWSKNNSYVTVESKNAESLLSFCNEIKSTPDILFGKSGKEIFDELNIDLNFNN